MQQTIVSVVLPVAPDKVADVRTALDTLHDRVKGPADYTVLRARLPTLHFFSMVIFDSTAGVPAGGQPVTPHFIIEANIDGAPGPFWAELESLAGEDIRGVLRLCQPPPGAEALFASVTAPGSRAPVAPLLERQSHFPAAGHMGNRGLSCARIFRHDALFQAVQKILPPPKSVLDAGAPAIHAWLRAALLTQDFPWLNEPYEEPIAAADKSADLRALIVFALLAIAAALLPWLALAIVLHPATVAALALLTGIVCTTQLQDIGDLAGLAGSAPAQPGAPRYPQAWLVLAAILVIALAIPLKLAPHGPAAWLTLCVAGLIASLLSLLAILRNRERADPIPAESTPDPIAVSNLRSWEDCHSGGPDHMASVVIIKPGRLRAFLIRFGLKALGSVVRVIATDGYLGSMRTIHFAHWAIVDGGTRLLFFSNFDGSWESYLDDFIEKAHAGLTLAWGNCTGFPPAEYLTLKGATQGRLFKNWARCSMTPSRFWYAAYPLLTVNQIVRQASVAKGLCAASLSPADAALWAKDL